MTDIELKKITANFDDVKELINKSKEVKKQETKLRRRLKTVNSRYSFLKDLIGIDSNDKILVESIVNYFKELGFEKVENVDRKFKEEDIRLRFDNLLLIFEVTGIDTANPKDDKAHQISKHIPSRKKQYPNLNVFGVFVVNHDNKKPYGQREKKPFRADLDKIAKNHNYTLTTTVDLLNAFIAIKKGTSKTSELIDNLCKTGILKVLGT